MLFPLMSWSVKSAGAESDWALLLVHPTSSAILTITTNKIFFSINISLVNWRNENCPSSGDGQSIHVFRKNHLHTIGRSGHPLWFSTAPWARRPQPGPRSG